MRIVNAAVGTLIAIALMSSSASAQQQVKLNQVGAALAMPLLGGIEGKATFLTVTNVGPVDRNLHFNVISEDWETVDFDCPVTASETVLIRWEPGQGFLHRLTVECNQAGLDPTAGIVERGFGFTKGILFVANETHACGDGSCTSNENDLFGDFVVVNYIEGSAYSGEAIPFQGKDPLAPGVADRDYLFDNAEYAMFPATLATNFIAPGLNEFLGEPTAVTAELILFTLDGRANQGSQASLDIVFYDDEETPTSTHYTFDCFSIVNLTDIDVNFAAALLGSGVGHLYMTAIDADQTSNVHDNKFGNGNAIRVVGVHGWLVQSVFDGMQGPIDILPVGAEPQTEIALGAAWARTLSQGTLPQDLDGSDVPALDGL